MADGRSEKYYSYRTEYQCYQKNATELNSMVSLSVSERRAFSIFNVRYLRHILYMAWRSMFCWVVFILRMADVGRGYSNSGCDDGIMPGSTTRHILPVQPPGMMFWVVSMIRGFRLRSVLQALPGVPSSF